MQSLPNSNWRCNPEGTGFNFQVKNSQVQLKFLGVVLISQVRLNFVGVVQRKDRRRGRKLADRGQRAAPSVIAHPKISPHCTIRFLTTNKRYFYKSYLRGRKGLILSWFDPRFVCGSVQMCNYNHQWLCFQKHKLFGRFHQQKTSQARNIFKCGKRSEKVRKYY